MTFFPAVLAICWLAATEPAPPALTLSEALAYSHAHSPALAEAQAELALAVAQTHVPRARWLPVAGGSLQALAATVNNTSAVNFTGNVGVALPRIGGRPYDPLLSAGSSAAWQPYASTLAAVGFEEQVFDFGRTAALIASADAAAAADRQELALQALDVKFTVTVAFLAVLAAQQIQTAANSAVARSQAHRDQAAAMVRGQLRSRIYLDRAQADLSRFQVGALRAEAGLAVAQATLAQALGAEAPLVDARGGPPAADPLPPLAEVQAAALDRDPRLKALQARMAAQTETARATAALALPYVYATGSVSLRSGDATAPGVAGPSLSGALPQTPNWDVGAVAAWTFLDPVSGAQAHAERTAVTAIAAQLTTARQAAVALAQTAWAEASAADRALPALQQALASAGQNYQQANVRFNQGLGTTVDIADAEVLLTDSQVELAQGEFQLQRSRARLVRAMAGGL